METVIRASRLTLGKIVLAAHAMPCPDPAARTGLTVGTAEPSLATTQQPRRVAADSTAVRLMVEEQLRKEFDERLQRKLDEQREDARKEGLAEGLAQGRAAAEKEASRIEEERRVRAEGIFSALQQAHASALSNWQDDIGSIAFEAICRVAGSKSTSREFVFGIVESVCREARAQGTVTARLHPRDVRLLAGEDDALKLPAGTHLTLIGDETVMLGGCVVETDAGLFEGSLDTQLRKLHAVLNRSTLIDGQV